MKFFVFDTETSGLFDYRKRADDEGQPRMIQFGGSIVELRGAEPTIVSIPVRPDGWTMDDELAAKLGHGMTQEWLLANGKPVAEALDAYEALHDQCDVIVGFNISFDQKVKRAELRRAGRPDRYALRPEFCLMRAMTPIVKIPNSRGGWKFPKLKEAYKFVFGVEPERQHQAGGDVAATIALLKWMIDQGHDCSGTVPASKLAGEEDDSKRHDNTRTTARAENRAEMATPAGGHEVGFLK